MSHYFQFYPSRLLALCIFIGHGIAIGALVFIPIPQTGLILLLLVLIWSALYYVLRDARLTLAGSWVALRLEEDHVVLFNRNGDELMGKLLPGSVVTPFIVILNIALQGRRGQKNVVLMPDSLNVESFRQLRVALKWGVTLVA
jgi:toxin CptA